MNKISVLSVMVIAICLMGGKSYSADWKFYGGFTKDKGGDEVLFYDASSISDSNNSIKFWVKSILHTNVEKVLGNKPLKETADKKVASGYKAPITKVFPEATSAVYLEEAANDITVPSSSEMLYQLVCSNKSMRRITGKSYKPDGVFDFMLGISQWETVAPGSNADVLATILCDPK